MSTQLRGKPFHGVQATTSSLNGDFTVRHDLDAADGGTGQHYLGQAATISLSAFDGVSVCTTMWLTTTERPGARPGSVTPDAGILHVYELHLGNSASICCGFPTAASSRKLPSRSRSQSAFAAVQTRSTRDRQPWWWRAGPLTISTSGTPRVAVGAYTLKPVLLHWSKRSGAVAGAAVCARATAP